MRQPISNCLSVVLARPRSPICAPRLNTATSIGPMFGLDVGDQLFDAAFFDRVDDEAAGRAALGFDFGHQPVEPGLVAAARQAGVVALAGKALGHVAADAGTGTEDQTDGLGHGRILLGCGGLSL